MMTPYCVCQNCREYCFTNIIIKTINFKSVSLALEMKKKSIVLGNQNNFYESGANRIVCLFLRF